MFQPTCNRFDHNDVLHQWLCYKQLADDELREVLGPLKGNSSDGDSRRRKLHLGQSCDTEGGERFKPVPV